MIASKQRYIVNAKGQRVEVIVPFDEYAQMLKQLEELEEIRAYDAAKASGEKPVLYKRAAKRSRGTSR